MNSRKLFCLLFPILFCFSVFAAPEKENPKNSATAAIGRKLLHNTTVFSAGALASTGLQIATFGLVQIMRGSIVDRVDSCLLGLGIIGLGYSFMSHLPNAILQIDKKYISKDKQTPKSDIGYFVAGFIAPLALMAYGIKRNLPHPQLDGNIILTNCTQTFGISNLGFIVVDLFGDA